DEFVAILEHHDYEFRESLLASFDKIIAGEQFEADGDILPVSVARGMGVYQPGMDYAAVFRQADEAMYENKAKVKKALL
ncbi:MAG: diguanylate cyclase, partial [Selenomonadaceae bacterium]|nr:diguanylate cyclase [Selenomonadaceae bacterium]